MEFLKIKCFQKPRKPKSQEHPDQENTQLPVEEPRSESTGSVPKAATDCTAKEEDEDDDDDDFIMNEVKRRLKELRKNSFMVLIPEEPCPEGEDMEEETSSSEWRETEVEDGYAWCGFDTFYNDYCERMLFFDRMSAQQFKATGSWNISQRPPRSTTKKLASTLRSLSFKKRELLKDDCEQLHQAQEDDPYQNLETAYVAQICLAWEALHCQYMQLSETISSQLENSTSYCYAAQNYQRFQVLLQRFIENEPFEEGSRAEIFARARSSFPMLLQVPSFQGSNKNEYVEDELASPILASELLCVIEDSILTFQLFLKMDKKKSGHSLNLLKGHHHDASSLHQVQASLDKKEFKLKELSKQKSWKKKKKKSWPSTLSEDELLLGLIDIRVVSRVLRMERISKEQLLWCEEKMSKIDVSENKLRRDAVPILFPC